ncbi:hypothetical protein ACN28S_45385 [Cystobacter fuscus]
MIHGLTADAAHIQEEDVFDAVLIEFDGFEGATFFQPGVDYHERCGAPQVIEFVGNLEHAAWLDHIFTAPMGLLLISKRMVRVLESVKPFHYRLIPATIYSDKIKHLVIDRLTRWRTWYEVQDPALRNDDFVILQLMEEIDCLDRDRTLVNGVPFQQADVSYLGMEEAQHLELRAPDGGFPPVFSVPELTFYCFTEEAKQACDKAGLKGLWWRPQR